MQDRYAGDIGDFGKFVMLKTLMRLSGGRLRLGINWYHVAMHESGSNDGRHTRYLGASRSSKLFEQCDPALYATLRGIVNNGERSILSLEQASILPANTVFYSRPLPKGIGRYKEREGTRLEWFAQSLSVLGSSDILFLDPDNGIQTRSVKITQKQAVKFAFVDELQTYLEQNKIVIIYNHRDRSPVDVYKQRFRDIHSQLRGPVALRVLRFKRVSVRDYLFFHFAQHSSLVDSLFTTLAAAPYNFLFDEFKLR